MLSKRPGLASVAALTLALGIGANAAIFSCINSLLLKPLPVPEADAMVRLHETIGPNVEASFSYPDYKDYNEKNSVFEGIFAISIEQAALSQENQNDVIWGEVVSGNYFDVLKVKPALGRAFLPEEDKTLDTHPVVVISHSLWQRRFAEDKSIVGKTIKLNGRAFTVIGIGPEGFYGSKYGLALDFWVPMMMVQAMQISPDLLTERGTRWLETLARLKPGVPIEQAQAEIATITQRLNEAYPTERPSNKQVIVKPEIIGRYEDAEGVITLSSVMAMVVVALILLIACANVANLLLARATERQKEIGIRISLGASRFRLLRQLLTESIMLSLAGGVVGLIFAYWLCDLMQSGIPALPYNMVQGLFAPDGRVLIFSFCLSVLTGIIFGIVPALHASNTEVVPILKGESGTMIGKSRRFSLKNALVVVQISLSLIVLVCGGLFLKSFRNAQKIDPGFKTENVMLLSLNPRLLGYDDEKTRALYTQLTERAAGLPGVKSVSVIERLPLADGSNSTGPIIKDGDPAPRAGEGIGVLTTVIGPGYFKTLDIPFTGRDFDARDKESAPRVAIINEELARRVWPGENALGKKFRIGDVSSQLTEVIGIAKNGKYRSLGENPRPFLYRPMTQMSGRGMTLIVSGASNPTNLVGAVRAEVRSLDPQLPIYNIKTMNEHLSWAFWGFRTGAMFALAFGLTALFLAATGLYSLMSYAVSQRTREIGVRMALGAQARDVLKLITWQGMQLVAVGMAIGLLASFAVTRFLASLLIGVSPNDFWTFGAIALLLILVALLACYVPARKATKVDPMNALRYE